MGRKEWLQEQLCFLDVKTVPDIERVVVEVVVKVEVAVEVSTDSSRGYQSSPFFSLRLPLLQCKKIHEVEVEKEW